MIEAHLQHDGFAKFKPGNPNKSKAASESFLLVAV
jgi:hypothetical protein